MPAICPKDLKAVYDHMTQLFPRGKCITFLLNQIGRPAGKIAQKYTVAIDYMSHMINGRRKVIPSIHTEITEALGFDPWDPDSAAPSE